MKRRHSISWPTGALLAVASAAAAQTQANGRIAYTTCDYNPAVGTVCDVWTMNPDGSGQVNLTNTPDINETQPAWSADGARLAYMRDEPTGQMLVVMNADGSGAADVTATPSLQGGPAWSPDGTRIAVARRVPGTTISEQSDIIVITLATGAEADITVSQNGLDFDEGEPAWSPDGTKIAFSAVRFEQGVDPITGGPVTYAQWEIVVANPDGTGQQIVSAGDPGTVRATRLEQDAAPAWSPDSQVLVFMSQNVDPCCDPWQIWRVARDGTGAALLSDNPLFNDMGPQFSPDGTLIVFSSDRDGGSDLYTIPASTGAAAAAQAMVAPDMLAAAAPTRLTTTGNANDPAWAREATAPPPPSFTLTVALTFGTHAGGLVASLPAGIFCGTDCTETFRRATTVLLAAVPKPGSRFTGWSGACTGRALYCVVAVDRARSVKAAFSRR